MTFRTTAVLALTIAGLVATGAQAQVRTETPAGVFVWEALGATPSIQLRKIGSGGTAPSATQAPAAKLQAPSGTAMPGAMTADAPSVTQQLKRPATGAVAPATPQGAR